MDRKSLDLIAMIKLLNSYGFKAWVCGGTARDIYLNRPYKNYDIAVNGTLQEIKAKLDSRVISVNEYSTYLQAEFKKNTYFLYPLKKIDLINTYYNFNFTNSLTEDASTRDFTINSLYYKYSSLNENLILLDYTLGYIDCDNKCIKFIHDPIERIQESKIRILRAVTLCSILGKGWFVDQTSSNAIQSERLKVHTLNSNQINVEMKKALILSDKPSKIFTTMKNIGILRDFCPELFNLIDVEQPNKNEYFNLFQHTMMAMDNVPDYLPDDKKLLLRVAALFHDIGKPPTRSEFSGDLHFYQHEKVGVYMTERILGRWGFDRRFINEVTNLIANHLFDANPSRTISSISKLIRRVGSHHIHDLIELRKADRLANHKHGISVKRIEQFTNKVNKILEKQSIEDLKLALTGDEIRELIAPVTDKSVELYTEMVKHLQISVKFKKVTNTKKSQRKHVEWLLSIKCPLDYTHLVRTWSDIYSGNADVYPDDKIKCGIYCDFKCNQLINNQNNL